MADDPGVKVGSLLGERLAGGRLSDELEELALGRIDMHEFSHAIIVRGMCIFCRDKVGRGRFISRTK